MMFSLYMRKIKHAVYKHNEFDFLFLALRWTQFLLVSMIKTGMLETLPSFSAGPFPSSCGKRQSSFLSPLQF